MASHVWSCPSRVTKAPGGQPELQPLGLSTHFLLGPPLGWGLPLTPGPVPRAMSTLFPSLLHQFLTLYSVQSLSVVSLWGSRWRWGWGWTIKAPPWPRGCSYDVIRKPPRTLRCRKDTALSRQPPELITATRSCLSRWNQGEAPLCSLLRRETEGLRHSVPVGPGRRSNFTAEGTAPVRLSEESKTQQDLRCSKGQS